MAKFGEFKFGEAKFGTGLEGYSLRITPDLGWADEDAMFSVFRNDMLFTLELDELSVVAEAPVSVKNLDHLVFEYAGSNFKVLRSQSSGLGGSGRHLWRIEWFRIQEFFLQRDAGRPKSLMSRARKSKVLR